MNPNNDQLNQQADELALQVRNAQTYPFHSVHWLKQKWWCHSDPHRELAYTVVDGEVRYPGDPIERSQALVEWMKRNPIVLPPLRRSQRKEFPNKFKVSHRQVTRAELNLNWREYLAGAYSFNDMWKTTFYYILTKAKKETDSFGLNRRDLGEDATSTFLISIRAAVEEKRHSGERGSKFSTFLDRAWRFHCISRFKDQKVEDGMFVSATEDEDGEDENGKTVEGVSLYDKYQLDRWNGQGSSEDLLRDVSSKAKEILPADELLIHKLIMDGLSQKDTATIVGKSRFAVARIQDKVTSSLQQALVPEEGSR